MLRSTPSIHDVIIVSQIATVNSRLINKHGRTPLQAGLHKGHTHSIQVLHLDILVSGLSRLGEQFLSREEVEITTDVPRHYTTAVYGEHSDASYTQDYRLKSDRPSP